MAREIKLLMTSAGDYSLYASDRDSSPTRSHLRGYEGLRDYLQSSDSVASQLRTRKNLVIHVLNVPEKERDEVQRDIDKAGFHKKHSVVFD